MGHCRTGPSGGPRAFYADTDTPSPHSDADRHAIRYADRDARPAYRHSGTYGHADGDPVADADLDADHDAFTDTHRYSHADSRQGVGAAF